MLEGRYTVITYRFHFPKPIWICSFFLLTFRYVNSVHTIWQPLQFHRQALLVLPVLLDPIWRWCGDYYDWMLLLLLLLTALFFWVFSSHLGDGFHLVRRPSIIKFHPITSNNRKNNGDIQSPPSTRIALVINKTFHKIKTTQTSKQTDK